MSKKEFISHRSLAIFSAFIVIMIVATFFFAKFMLTGSFAGENKKWDMEKLQACYDVCLTQAKACLKEQEKGTKPKDTPCYQQAKNCKAACRNANRLPTPVRNP